MTSFPFPIIRTGSGQWFAKFTMACLAIGIILPSLAAAQSETRPKTEDLLPETTVLFVQIENTRDMVEKMGASNMGRMLRDERIAPLASELYNQALDAYSDIEETVGLSVEELQSLPSGEVCFAVVAPKRKDPVVVLMIDVDEENETVNKALDRGRDLAEQQGITIDTDESDDGVEFEKFRVNDQDVTMFRKDGTLVVSNSRDVIDGILERWMGRQVEKIRPLSKNRKFITIMNRCRGTKESPPEARLFVDPIAFAKSALRGNLTAQAALNFFPVLGLDGLLGVGGAVLMNEQEFESVFHGHVLLSNPRKGIFEMISLKPDEYRPQTWVPNDVTNYITTSWDVPTMFSELEKIVDAFTSEGYFQESIKDNINEEIGLDFEQDVINNLAGRVTYVQWVSRPIRINSTTNIVGIQVNDEENAQEVVDLILAKIREENNDEDDNVAEKEYQGQVYYTQSDSQIERREERRRERRERRAEERGTESPRPEIRQPRPCFTLLEDHVIICDSVEALERVIDTHNGDEIALSDDDQFQMISGKMTRLLGTDMPSALFFSRPAEQIRLFFELANEQSSKDFLDSVGEDNKYVRGLKSALDENPLPNFDDIQHYFPPQGSFVTDDDTGLHLLTFQMRAEDQEETSKND